MARWNERQDNTIRFWKEGMSRGKELYSRECIFSLIDGVIDP